MSIKVAVRVRPFNEREKQGNSKCCVKMVSIIGNLVLFQNGLFNLFLMLNNMYKITYNILFMRKIFNVYID